MAGREAEIITRTDRALAKAAAGGGKSATAVTSSFIKGSMAASASKEKKMQKILSASCPRLTGQSTVVGTTVISYDKDGVCHLPDHANTLVDFEMHCRQNGVTRLPDIIVTAEGEAPPPPPPAPPPLQAADVAPPGAEFPPAPAPEPEPLPEVPVVDAAPAEQSDPVPVADAAPADQASVADDSTKKKSSRRR